MSIEILNFETEYASELVKMWRTSFQRAMGLEESNRFDEFTSQLAYFKRQSPDGITMVIDTSCSKVVGFMILNDAEIDQLYVHVDYQRAGIGGRLLQIAFNQSPTGLELFTFQLNTIAPHFYRAKGFVEVARGRASASGNPWANSEEQLLDIKFRWDPANRL